MEMTMRKFVLTMLALSAAGVVTLATSAPAAAYDYPWCVQGRGVGIPGDCSYQTYAQCEASASGRGLYCNSNPRAALNANTASSNVRMVISFVRLDA